MFNLFFAISVLLNVLLIFILYRHVEFRKNITKDILSLNSVEFECLQIMISKSGTAGKDNFKRYHYNAINNLAEDCDLLVSTDGYVTGWSLANALDSEGCKVASLNGLQRKPIVKI